MGKPLLSVVKPLTVLTSPKLDWRWSDKQQQAFDEVKQRFMAASILLLLH